MKNIKNIKNVMFVFAHYDDEAFSFGTIKKHIDAGDSVSIVIVCGNGASLEDNRKTIFLKNCESYNIWFDNLNFFDLTLSDLQHDIQNQIKTYLTTTISVKKIDIVYTNNSSDLHSDHRKVSQMIRTICRPSKTNIQALYECYIPGAAEYNQTDLSGFKTIVDVSAYIKEKNEVLDKYNDYLSGASDKIGSLLHAKYIGNLYYMEYAEQFKLIWETK